MTLCGSEGLRLTLDLNSNWVSHGTLASDKQAITFLPNKYMSIFHPLFGVRWSKVIECTFLSIINKQAALVVLGGPRDFPSLRVSNLLVAPGRETWVEVSPWLVFSTAVLLW